ncbi:hypothetical protein FQZ97_1099500 [compost metagenome]
MPCMRGGADPGGRLCPGPQPAPLRETQRARGNADRRRTAWRRTPGALPALSCRPPSPGRHGRPRGNGVRPVSGGQLVAWPLRGVARGRPIAGSGGDGCHSGRAVGGLHLLRPRAGSPQPGHARHPATDRMGAPRWLQAPVPGLLDRWPSQDGLQAAFPAARMRRWSRLGA